jgi:hypothetical protein
VVNREKKSGTTKLYRDVVVAVMMIVRSKAVAAPEA